MHEFLTYFLSHMPSRDKWVDFLVENSVACVATRNSVLSVKNSPQRHGTPSRDRPLEEEVHSGLFLARSSQVAT